MKQRVIAGVSAAAIVLVTALYIFPACSSGQGMPFGGPEDSAFAAEVWKGIEGYPDWPLKSDFYPGKSPHGMFLRTYYSIVTIDGMPYHTIVKDNYGGENIKMEDIMQDPEEYLLAVTVMVQREPGYDEDNHNWYWVKYNAEGEVDKNEDGVMLAGKVAKGMDTGCIACHAKAKHKDYIFINDGEM
jgi:hypothetical protein